MPAKLTNKTDSCTSMLTNYAILTKLYIIYIMKGMGINMHSLTLTFVIAPYKLASICQWGQAWRLDDEMV